MTGQSSLSSARYQIPDWFLECNVKTAADLSAAPDQIVFCNCADCKEKIADDYGSDADLADEKCPDKAGQNVEEDGAKELDDGCGSSLGRELCTDKIRYSTFAKLRDMTAAALVTDRGGKVLRPEASAVVFRMEREDYYSGESCMEPVWMGRAVERVAKALGVSLVTLDLQDLEELGCEFYRQDKEAQRCDTSGDAAIPLTSTSERPEGDAEAKQDGSMISATSTEEGENKYEEAQEAEEVQEAVDIENAEDLEDENENASIKQQQWEPDLCSLSAFVDHFFAARAERYATAESWQRTQLVWTLLLDAVRDNLATESNASEILGGTPRPSAVIFHITDYRSVDDSLKRRVLARFAGKMQQRRKQGDAVVMIVSTQDYDLWPDRRLQRKIGATKASTTVARYVKMSDAGLKIRERTYNGTINARALRHCLRECCAPIFPADLLKVTADWACAERSKSLRGLGDTIWTSEDMGHIVTRIMGRAWLKPELRFSDIRAVLKRLGFYNPVEPEAQDAPPCSEKAESEDNDKINAIGNTSEENTGNISEAQDAPACSEKAESEDNDKSSTVGDTSEDNTDNASEDNPGNASEHDTGITSEDNTDNASEDNNDNAVEDNTGNTSEDNTGNISEDTTPVEELSEILQGLDLNCCEADLTKCIVNSGTLKTSWDDVIIAQETKELMQQFVASHSIQFDCESEFLRQALRMRGALLYGPPGTGKTHLSRAVATASGSRMLAISPSSILFSPTGESERYIEAAFTLAAKLHPCVLFIDEADSLFYRRSSSDKSWERTQTNQFLQQMDGLTQNDKAPLVLVATNRPWDLDEAFLRRLQHKIYLGLPNTEARARILRLFLHQGDLEPTVDVDGLAQVTGKYSGSDLKTLCAKAGLLWQAEQARLDTLYKSVSDKFAMANEAPKKVQLGINHFVKALHEIQPTNSEDLAKGLEKFSRKHNPTASTSNRDPGIRFIYNSSSKRYDRVPVRDLISRIPVSDDVPALNQGEPENEMQLQAWCQLDLRVHLLSCLLRHLAVLLFFSRRILEHQMQLQDWCQMDLRTHLMHRLHTNLIALLFCIHNDDHALATLQQTGLDLEDSTAAGSNLKPLQKTQKTARRSKPRLKERASAAETASFRYTTLGKDEFRLLEIAPGKKDDPLVCTLKHTSFQSNEWYCALSYTWGSPEPPFFIKCDGSGIRITRSLHEALIRMRRTWRPVLIWADAICINQRDNSEKSQQVMRMREIYAKASRLFIWLGNPVTASDADVAVRALDKLRNYVNPLGALDNKTSWTREVLDEIWQKMKQAEIEAMEENEWLQLRNFLLMPWFSRVWIFQEVASVMAVSPFNILVGYGNRTVNCHTVLKNMSVPASFGRCTISSTMHRELRMEGSLRNVNIYCSEDGKNEERVAEALARKSPQAGHFDPEDKATTRIAIVIDLRRLVAEGSSHSDISQPDSGRDAALMLEVVLHMFSDEFRAVGKKLMEEVDDMMIDELALSALGANVQCEDGDDSAWWQPGHPLFLGLRFTVGFVAGASVKYRRGRSVIEIGLKTATFSHMPNILERMWPRMQLARRLEATDLRDKVYAFLGMFGENVADEPLLKVDYSLSVTDVYINLTIYFLQRLMCLDVLEFVNDMPTRTSRLDNLPSWAIDLTSPTDLDLFNLGMDFNAGGALILGTQTNFPMFPMHVLQVNVSNDRKRLDLDAFLVGEVTELGFLPHHYEQYDHLTGNLYRGEDENIDENIKNAASRTYSLVLDMINNLGQSTRTWKDINMENPHAALNDFPTAASATFKMPSRLYLTGQRMFEVFWRCLGSSGDMKYQTRDGPNSALSLDESKVEMEQVYRDFIDMLSKGYIPLNTARTDGYQDAASEPFASPDPTIFAAGPTAGLFLAEFQRTSLTRVFGVVANELIGWFPRRAQKGDMLAILPGARCPYVLRRARRDASIDRNKDANEDDAAQEPDQLSEWEVIGHAYVQGLMNDIVTPWQIDLTKEAKEMLGKLNASGEAPAVERICLV